MADKIDFSKLESLSPRSDSWAKVCSRLDANDSTTRGIKGPRNIIYIKNLLGALPLAASLVLVSLTALLPSFTNSTEEVSIQSLAPQEISNWYSNLGQDENDDFDTFEEAVSFSFLTKE